MSRSEAAQNVLAMRRYKKQVTCSKEAAVYALIQAGIFTESGQVAVPYQQLLKSEEKEHD